MIRRRNIQIADTAAAVNPINHLLIGNSRINENVLLTSAYSIAMISIDVIGIAVISRLLGIGCQRYGSGRAII
jgi:hypothetical protein